MSVSGVSLGYESHRHESQTTEADIKMIRVKAGQCPECGNRLIEITKFLGIKKKVFINNDYATNGRCLYCNPVLKNGPFAKAGRAQKAYEASCEVASATSCTVPVTVSEKKIAVAEPIETEEEIQSEKPPEMIQEVPVATPISPTTSIQDCVVDKSKTSGNETTPTPCDELSTVFTAMSTAPPPEVDNSTPEEVSFSTIDMNSNTATTENRQSPDVIEDLESSDEDEDEEVLNNEESEDPSIEDEEVAAPPCTGINNKPKGNKKMRVKEKFQQFSTRCKSKVSMIIHKK